MSFGSDNDSPFLRDVIAHGVRTNVFRAGSERLASYAILDMGMGVAAWYREGGDLSPEEIAYAHADFAIGILRRVE